MNCWSMWGYIEKYDKIYVEPVIIKYELDIEKLKNLKGIIFNEPDKTWAEFVFNNRVKNEKFRISELHNCTQNFDYVYGPLADGLIMRLVDFYKYNRFNIDSFLEKIMPKFPDNNDQLSFHSKEGISCLKFMEVIKNEHYNYTRR